jgi:hypothetical protein
MYYYSLQIKMGFKTKETKPNGWQIIWEVASQAHAFTNCEANKDNRC